MGRDCRQSKRGNIVHHFRRFAIQKTYTEFCNFGFTRMSGDFCHIGVENSGVNEPGLILIEAQQYGLSF